MLAGTLFLWDKYPHQDDGVTKNRYFVYLGKSGCYCPITVTLSYITTKFLYYENDGKRHNHSIIKVKSGQYNLPQDSIFDFDLLDYHDNSHFESQPITTVYEFTQNEIKTIIWPKIKTSKIPKKIKEDIRHAFSMRGISKLKL